MLSNNAVLSIMKTFDWCDIPKKIAISSVYPYENVPASNWSLLNRVIMCAYGSSDARGVKQWEVYRRYPVKKAKPIYIVCPQIEANAGLKGFVSVPVYSADQTYGDPIEYIPKEFPVFSTEKARLYWNIAHSIQKEEYTLKPPIFDDLTIADDDTKRFIWEMSKHAYYSVYKDKITRSDKRIVIELTALSMLYLLGMKVVYEGRYFERIQEYAKEAKLSTIAAIFNLMKTTDFLLKEIFSIGT